MSLNHLIKKKHVALIFGIANVLYQICWQSVVRAQANSFISLEKDNLNFSKDRESNHVNR